MEKQAFDFVDDYDEGLAMQMAEEAAGNWQDFESFAWSGAPEENADNWTIVYTSNRDSGLLDQSNAKVIEAVMEGFPEDQVRAESHSHWAVGYVDGYSIRVYNPDGSLTDAFKAWTALKNAMDRHPILDEEAYSELEMEAEWENTHQAMEMFLHSHENEVFQDLPDSPEKLDELTSSFLEWMNSGGRQTVNSDDQGYWPRDEKLQQWSDEVLESQFTGADTEQEPVDPRQMDLPFDGREGTFDHKRAQAQVTEEEYWTEVVANAEGALEVARETGKDFQKDLQAAVSEHADSYVGYYSGAFDVLRFTDNLSAADAVGNFPQDDVLAFITKAARFSFEHDVYDTLYEMGAFEEPAEMRRRPKPLNKGAGCVFFEYWPKVARIAQEGGAAGRNHDQAMDLVESEIYASAWVANARAAVDTIQLSDNEHAILEAGKGIPDNVETALAEIAYWAMRADVLQHSDFQTDEDRF